MLRITSQNPRQQVHPLDPIGYSRPSRGGLGLATKRVTNRHAMRAVCASSVDLTDKHTGIRGSKEHPGDRSALILAVDGSLCFPSVLAGSSSLMEKTSGNHSVVDRNAPSFILNEYS